MRTIIIGDMHGCVQDFKDLLATADYKAGKDRLVVLGDFMGKGSVRGQLKLAGLLMRWTTQRGNRVIALKGNHEAAILGRARVWTGKDNLRRLGRLSPEQAAEHADYTGTPEGQIASMVARDTALACWLEDLPPLYRLPQDEQPHEKGTLCVHAGVLSRWQSDAEIVLGQKAARTVRFVRNTTEQEIIVRYVVKGDATVRLEDLPKAAADAAVCRSVVRERGRMLKRGHIKPEADPVFWAEQYQGHLGHVYFGHTPFKWVRLFPHATSLDTGIWKGGVPVAVILDGKAAPSYITCDNRGMRIRHSDRRITPAEPGTVEFYDG